MDNKEELITILAFRHADDLHVGAFDSYKLAEAEAVSIVSANVFPVSSLDEIRSREIEGRYAIDIYVGAKMNVMMYP